MTPLTTDAQFESWGWRVPFLASLILVGLGLWIRLHLEETPEFEREAVESEPEERAPISTLFRTQWRSMVLVGGLVAAPLALSHLYQVDALSYLKDRGYDATVGSFGLIIAGVTVMIVAPLAGIASDKFGRRRVLMTGAGFAIAFAFPFFWLVNTDQPLWAMAALAIAQGGSVGIAFEIGRAHV